MWVFVRMITDEAFTEVSKMFFSVRGVVGPRLSDASSSGLLKNWLVADGSWFVVSEEIAL